MNESDFTTKIKNWLSPRLAPTYKCETGRSLLYKVIVDTDGTLKPANPMVPSRGQFAFKTDVLISHNELPLVVVELKYGGFSTHDVLTYSAKAVRHKEIYPYLRYGFAVGGQDGIDLKFFTHNVGFDFAIAVPREGDDLQDLTALVGRQLEAAEQLVRVLDQGRRGSKPKEYETIVNLRWGDDEHS